MLGTRAAMEIDTGRARQDFRDVIGPDQAYLVGANRSDRGRSLARALGPALRGDNDGVFICALGKGH